jgi:hypothetical protein
MKIKHTPEEIINSLEGIGRAEPSPYFYSRLQGKIAKEENGFVISLLRFLTNPSLSIGVALLFIMINGYFLMNNMKKEINIDDNAQNIAAEYVPQNLNPYENLTETP